MDENDPFRPKTRVKQHTIAAQLRQDIVAGRLQPGQRLPTRSELGLSMGVSLNTVQGGLESLAREGFVVARGSRGTFVADHPPHRWHYGLVFEYPEESFSISGFWASMFREADRLSRNGTRKVRCYFAPQPHPDNETYIQLQADVAARRLAGLIFTTNPRYLGVENQIMEDPGMPRVVMTNTPFPNTMTLDFDYETLIEQALDAFVAQGRRRLAVVNLADVGPKDVQFIQAAAQKRQMLCPVAWVQGVDHRHPHWANPVVQLLMQGPPDERPDALLFTDDNLVEPGTAGLLAAGISSSAELAVIAHANFPDATRSHVQARRIGFDVRQALAQAMALIDMVHAGKPAPAATRMRAVFAEELGHAPRQGAWIA